MGAFRKAKQRAQARAQRPQISPRFVQQLVAELISSWHQWRATAPPASLLASVGRLALLMRKTQPPEISPEEWTRWIDLIDKVLGADAPTEARLDVLEEVFFVSEVAAAMRGAS